MFTRRKMKRIARQVRRLIVMGDAPVPVAPAIGRLYLAALVAIPRLLQAPPKVVEGSARDPADRITSPDRVER